jgi:MSHA pilin protein MshA
MGIGINNEEVGMAGSQKGFTLIELIVVILILGVLSATALPRFMNAQVDARVAKAQGLYGAVRSAASLAKARCELDLGRGLSGAGECGNATPHVTFRYPAATAAGILAATQLNAASDGLSITAGPPYRIEVLGAATPANCSVSYTDATAAAAPLITLDVTAC